jgi:hypothetical protein
MDGKEKAERLELLKKKKEKLAKQIAVIQKAKEQRERKADTHLKIVLGAYYLKYLEGETVPPENALHTFEAINSGIEKVGLARDKFEAMKAKKLAQVEAKKRAQQAQVIQRPNMGGTTQTNVSH